MATYHAKRALEILWEEGPVELGKRSKEFFIWNLVFTKHHRIKIHTFKNKWYNKLKFDYPANPYKIIFVKSEKIKYWIKTDNDGNYVIPPDKYHGIGQVREGDWDSPENRHKVHEMSEINYFEQRFNNGRELTETDRYDYLTSKYTEETAKTRLQRYDDLFHNIKNNGYQLRDKNGNLRPGTSEHVRDRFEVFVTIDRNGNINLFDGRHRLGITRILDIELPVQVVCRHQKWQELRDEVHNNGLPEGREDLRDHPDLQDILGV